MSYDAVIIGAGMSGLAAGIRLAYYEKKVCLLERHWTIGGLNSFYRLRGRDHDVGLHAVTNYAERGNKTGALSKVLRQLRLDWDDFDLTPQNGSAVAFPGCRLNFSNDFELLRSEIVRAFPSEAAGFDRLAADVADYPLDSFRLSGESARAKVSEFLRDRLLIEMIFCPLLFYGGASPHDMDYSQFVIMFRSIFQEGFGRPHQGVRRILRVLIKKFRELGGELRLRTGVRSILHRDGAAYGVELDSGEIIEGERIISSAGSVETLRMCGLVDEDTPRMEPGAITYAETIFSLDRQPAELGHHETIVFYNDSNTFHYDKPREPLDLRSGIICSPNNFQYDKPLDEGRVRITALADPAAWLELPEEEYQARKQEWADRLVQSAIRFMPDFREAVVDTDMFTPRTVRRFTSHVNGCVYGASAKVPDGRTALDGLYLCGNDQGLLGIIGTLMSGISVANAYALR